MDIHESVDQILAADNVLGTSFYDVFLKYPEVQEFFADVNLQRQSVLLTMALLVIEQCYTGDSPVVNEYLRDLGVKHDKMSIPKRLYPYFQEALLKTLQNYHGDDWSESLEEQWTNAIERASQQMLRGYS